MMEWLAFLTILFLFLFASASNSENLSPRDLPPTTSPFGYPVPSDTPPTKGPGPGPGPGPGLVRTLQCIQPAAPVLGPHGPLPVSRYGLPHDPLQAPAICVRVLMDEQFGRARKPYAAKYEPPPECTFNRVLLNLSVTAEGIHRDHMGIMYLGDFEIWRTSTAQPREGGVTWEFWKDMTAYINLWNTSQTFIFDMPIPADHAFSGTFHIKITAVFFKWEYFELQTPKNKNNWPGPRPPDQIFPINARKGADLRGSAWAFPDTSGNTSTTHKLPRNAYRAHVSIAATGHGNEEFWWSNVPGSVANSFENTTGALPSNTGYREIHLYIDDYLAGVVWPFPMVFSGGIAAPLHRPLVPIQAFDIREQEIDITHWLGYLSDGAEHQFTLRVYGIDDSEPMRPRTVTASSYWLLSGKIFLWIDAIDGITNGTMPEILNNEFIFEQSSMPRPDFYGDIDRVGYETTLRRRFKVRSRVRAPSREYDFIVEQNLDGMNQGQLQGKGSFQHVNATYRGEVKTRSHNQLRFFSGFNYPITSFVTLKGPSDACKFHLDAEFYQGMETTMNGDTAFPYGIEPWRDALFETHDTIAGSSTSAYRQSYASFCEDAEGRMSTGNSSVRGGFKLAAVDFRRSSASFIADILVYTRVMASINETIAHDGLRISKIGTNYDFSRDGQRASAVLDAKLNPPGGFAPLGNDTWRAFMGKFLPKLWQERLYSEDDKDSDDNENGSDDAAEQNGERM